MKKNGTGFIQDACQANETAKKGGTMKTVALLALLTLAVVSASGCHWMHRHNNYSNGYSSW